MAGTQAKDGTVAAGMVMTMAGMLEAGIVPIWVHIAGAGIILTGLGIVTIGIGKYVRYQC